MYCKIFPTVFQNFMKSMKWPPKTFSIGFSFSPNDSQKASKFVNEKLPLWLILLKKKLLKLGGWKYLSNSLVIPIICKTSQFSVTVWYSIELLSIFWSYIYCSSYSIKTTFQNISHRLCISSCIPVVVTVHFNSCSLSTTLVLLVQEFHLCTLT